MSFLPICLQSTRTFKLTAIEFLLLLDVSIGDNDRAANAKKEEHSRYVCPTHSKFVNAMSHIHLLSERWPMKAAVT